MNANEALNKEKQRPGEVEYTGLDAIGHRVEKTRNFEVPASEAGVISPEIRKLAQTGLEAAKKHDTLVKPQELARAVERKAVSPAEGLAFMLNDGHNGKPIKYDTVEAAHHVVKKLQE